MYWNYVYLIKILIAVVCSGIIGAEREYAGKSAGLRTFIMVGLGACIFSIISQEAVKLNGFGDPSRIAAQIVVGIGFIGAGLIILQQDTQTIKGLTTAAGLWVVAAIGMTVGFGHYILAGLGTTIGIIVLMGLRGVERFLDRHAELAHQKRLREGKEE